jgi:glycosyltransferase involved in cell wall biosynthesis
MTAPDVSVVVPVYNTMPYLTRCLDSLVAQSLGLRRIQVIAIDDGSTDDSPEVLDSYAERHPASFRVVHQANSGGPAGPCNRGLQLATGRYVFFIGADDYLGREALERLVRAATHWDSDVIFGRMVGVGRRYVDQRMFGGSRREVNFLNSPLAYAVSNTKLFRRSLIEQHQIRYALDLRVSSDQPFTVAALLKARRVSVLSGYEFYYAVRRADDSNISYSNHWTTRLSDITAIMEHLAGLVEPGPTRDALFQRHFHWEMDKLLRNELPKLDDREQRELIKGVSAVADRYLTPGVSQRLPPKFRLPISLAQANRLDTLREVLAYQRTKVPLALVLSGHRVFEWAPGFSEADDSADWYEVLTDDLGKRLAERLDLTARAKDRGLEINGPVGLHASSAAQLRVLVSPVAGAGRIPAVRRFARGAAPDPAWQFPVDLHPTSAHGWTNLRAQIDLRPMLSSPSPSPRWVVRLRIDAGASTWDFPVRLAGEQAPPIVDGRRRHSVALRAQQAGDLVLSMAEVGART